MGKLFAVVVTLIALASAAIFALHIWWVPPDISTHGSRIDRQLNETMIVAGVLFVGAQLALAFFVWRFSARGTTRPVKSFPGGPTPMVVLATVLVGAEILVLTFVGNDLAMAPAWAAAADIGERYTGVLSGAMNMIASFMAAIEAIILGQLLDANYLVLPFVILACSYGLGTLAWIGVDVRRTLAESSQLDEPSTA